MEDALLSLDSTLDEKLLHLTDQLPQRPCGKSSTSLSRNRDTSNLI